MLPGEAYDSKEKSGGATIEADIVSTVLEGEQHSKSSGSVGREETDQAGSPESWAWHWRAPRLAGKNGEKGSGADPFWSFPPG